MRWLARLLGRAARLDPALDERVARWRQLARSDNKALLEDARVVVVDVETTGLDPGRDRLIAIGAVSVCGMRLEVGQGFEVVIRDIGPADDAVLIHGIAPAEREQGEEAPEAVLRFLELAGSAMLVAFHAPFDRRVLEVAASRELGVRMRNRWLDLAWLAPALYPEVGPERGGLDAWLDRFGLRPHVRHRALGDALITGELFLILLHRARASGIRDLAGLRRLAHAQERVSRASAGVTGV